MAKKTKRPARRAAKPGGATVPQQSGGKNFRPANLSMELFMMIAQRYLLSTNFTGFLNLVLLNRAFQQVLLNGSDGIFRRVLPTLYGGVLPALKKLAAKYWKQRSDQRKSIGRVLEGVATGFRHHDDSQYIELKQFRYCTFPSEESLPNRLIINIAQQMQCNYSTSIAHTDLRLLSKHLKDVKREAVNEYSR
jgi:hypothetical protein